MGLTEELRNSGDLGHVDRFKLLMRLLRDGASDDDVHEVFRHAHNYDFSKTAYYIKHARKTYDTSARHESVPKGPWAPATGDKFISVNITRPILDAIDKARGHVPASAWAKDRLYLWMLDTPEPLRLPDSRPVEDSSLSTTIIMPEFMLDVVDDVRGKESRSSWLRRFLWHATEDTL